MASTTEVETDVEIVVGALKLMLSGLTPKERLEVVTQLQSFIGETNWETLIWL